MTFFFDNLKVAVSTTTLNMFNCYSSDDHFIRYFGSERGWSTLQTGIDVQRCTTAGLPKTFFVKYTKSVFTEDYISEFLYRSRRMRICIKPSTCKLQKRCALFIENLTIIVPITTAADDIHKYFFIVFRRK